MILPACRQAGVIQTRTEPFLRMTELILKYVLINSCVLRKDSENKKIKHHLSYYFSILFFPIPFPPPVTPEPYFRIFPDHLFKKANISYCQFTGFRICRIFLSQEIIYPVIASLFLQKLRKYYRHVSFPCATFRTSYTWSR